jgi:pimeloyl-ACP methyl ester carboxylesterase
VSLQRGTDTASLIPGAKHVVLPGTGHACCIEDPAAFEAAVREFLEANGLWPRSVIPGLERSEKARNP